MTTQTLDRPNSVGAVFGAFLVLGLTSFGGPIAHLGYFRRAFVEKRRWLDDASYADLVALCQFLPGPTSSQVGFAIGLARAGPLGALAAFSGFTLPSALLMFAAALGAASIEGPFGAALLHGLKLAAVAVVADAVLGMARTLTPDPPRRVIALLAAAIVLLVASAFAQVLAIAFGALAYRLLGHPAALPPATPTRDVGIHPRAAFVALALFAALAIVPPLLAANGGHPLLDLFDAFFRSGSLVFGGGHVVLPLLEAELVASGWLDMSTFLAGYGAAQVMPGPLFTVAAFLGALSAPASSPAVGAAVALAAIFLPGFLLLLAALPAWTRLRASPAARAALAGANAAVVGLLADALVGLVFGGTIASLADGLIVALAFAALHVARLPPLLVVAASAGAVLVAQFIA
ncbi:chromate efflux transporter [Aureimonas phyllosphaerae]|uniref:Chromate transporter n=1 Tax=Aureimonas phyllosphaerae TaxID=1166078 RepID=A0A7W6BW10_9HYPH|nr:chromate efflux transporter [Aureimonas phyllosphaerae]MBB3935770.1 chromate transporter [Aureimonas phyllosphaerae]MBB3959778.1 chromate transporter [Aureimonas phyllosphaerae]SFF14917.1 chromate transporter [Aureimonas phyllosphaerae]